jgi:hypothetical protein
MTVTKYPPIGSFIMEELNDEAKKLTTFDGK